MQMGGESLTVRAGDFVHIPAVTVHGYANTSDRPTRFLAWAIGGAIDEFFIEMSEKIRQLPDDLPKLTEILDRHGIQMAAPD
ncbi:hypothetical protein TUMEXPCC7403_18155 [Tumidithrix helvetica PCC 7403]